MFILNRSHADDIDQVLFELHRNPAATTELERLGNLFAQRAFLRKLAAILRAASQAHRTPGTRVTVQLDWIDKRPYLASISTPKVWHNKVEVGDAAVFFIDEIRARPSSPVPRTAVAASGLILQAKRTTAFSAQLPTVHVHNNASSRKEYALLSAWPPADLYLSTHQSSLLLSGLDFQTGYPALDQANTRARGWYVVTPNSQPAQIVGTAGSYGFVPPYDRDWRSPWMGAPSVFGRRCGLTLGRMLVGFFTRAAAHARPQPGAMLFPRIGQAFDLVRGWTPAQATGSGWDDLCNALLSLKNKRIGGHGGPGARSHRSQRILAFCYEPSRHEGFVGGIAKAADMDEESGGEHAYPILTVRRTGFSDWTPNARDRDRFADARHADGDG
ncbi:hypothetical protein G4G28_12215 [Massilia sp. Dwa41.01b]|uniref:hypothetical protein n=1 Tax=unclassified Massilia TaxID=2609279 RepID=UPI00160406FC|nr:MULTISPECIES: hypothetical protein [unclassified Massilia]QNA89053.1 hypothetical protein G4G28_12215 [Massilia sp. Dwa41.01b]QNA99941.1 hypothetical protein G4G31_15830 [Massilia sp. Se16.2.3]